MNINLIPDESVGNAPVGFAQAIQSAADILGQDFAANITLNIRYGWGTFDNQSDSTLNQQPTYAVGGPLSGTSISYTELRELARQQSNVADGPDGD